MHRVLRNNTLKKNKATSSSFSSSSSSGVIASGMLLPRVCFCLFVPPVLGPHRPAQHPSDAGSWCGTPHLVNIILGYVYAVRGEYRRKSDLSSTVVTGQKISRKSDLLSSRRGLARNGAPHQRVLGIVNRINRTIGDRDAGLYVARRQI